MKTDKYPEASSIYKSAPFIAILSCLKKEEIKIAGSRALREHLEMYGPLADHAFAEALACFSFRIIPKNTILIQPGDAVHHTHWVAQGLLFSAFQDDAGKEHILQFATNHCWITDQNGFYNHAPATFRVQTLEASALFSLSFADREKLCEHFPVMGHFFRKKANDSFVKQQKRLLTYMTTDAQQRFDQLMQEFPGLGQRVPKHILAAYLGVTRETLSRFKKK